ncbi:MAG: hypothetical protein K2R98_31695 [Gemmataceae bacterium]|nr:hypothetical protein [Gemmataceae bacterium]
MKERLALFAIGLLARIGAELASRYSDWLFARLREASQAGFDIWADLRAFGDWLLRDLGCLLTGRRLRHACGDETLDEELYR